MNRLFWQIVIAIIATQSVYADWSRYLGDNGNGHSDEVGIMRSWSEKGPKVVWQNSLGMGYGGASIKGNEVYVFDRVEDKKNILRCFDLNTGEELWSKSFAVEGQLSYNGSRSTPTIGEKFVYALGPFGNLYCINRETHEEVWTKSLPDLYNFRSTPHRWGFAQSPLLHDNKVIVAPCVPNRAGIVAFDAKTGEEVWHNKDFHGQTYVSPMVYNIAGQEQVLMIVPRSIVGLDVKTGKALWVSQDYKNPIPIPTANLIDENRLFVTGGYRSGSIFLEVKKKDSSFEVTTLAKMENGAQIHPGILFQDHLYVNINENGNLHEAPNLACINLKGEIKWQTSDGPEIDRGAIICVDGLLIILGGKNGFLYLIEPNSKSIKVLAKVKMFEEDYENYIWAPMAFSQGKLIIRDQTTIKCVDLMK